MYGDEEYYDEDGYANHAAMKDAEDG